MRRLGEALGGVALAALAADHAGDTVLGTLEPWNFDPLVFARTLVAPAIPEELFWRVFLRPGPRLFSPRSLSINAAFAVSHVATAEMLAPLRPGAVRVFRDPAFLSLAFVLGIACTHAHLTTRTLAAPVLVHAAAVSVWLSCWGGDVRLMTPPS
ncbi:hypothetical protein CTAYLR_009215 [Chrysophaeum taylorii]|uniref:CAAX prenyl protease 2/Lysostaphin resistance protein A-like domain-containing protein n=1 Tax=Chrysophaeum taylorii TaxID=2483200 RepID=A0AAD7XIE2_9STRA|nr:hypothetical protein CTAYLR_009215 [Chrysophaeum taylorii]